MMETDVVVIGAGAAGIGAGMALREAGRNFVILEAAHRVGGRAFTDRTSLPRPWDQGCHWFHSANINPLVAWADTLGINYIREERGENAYSLWTPEGFISDAEMAEAGEAIDTAFGLVEEQSDSGRDVAVPEILPDAGRWQAEIDLVMSLMDGDDAHRVSASGYADYVDTETDWPVEGGYGSLFEAMAADLPIRTGVAVRRVAEDGGVTVETADGVLRARAAIITVSTNVLASGDLTVGPGPAGDMAESLGAKVPCGSYEKMAFAMRKLPDALDGRFFCSVNPGHPRQQASVQIIRGDVPLMVFHTAGDTARGLAAEGQDAMIAQATDSLVAMFGAAIRNDILGAAATGWTLNPLIRGSYSHAVPGAAEARRRMIATDTGAIRFAGEALSPKGQATAHGAWASGQAVATDLCAKIPPN